MRIVLMLGVLMLSMSAFAQNESGLDLSLANQLGSAAGAAYACKAGKRLEDYEVIASRLLANLAATDADERTLNETYVEAKVQAIKLHKSKHPMACKEILQRFKAMRIFKFVVYADGSVRMDDGTMSHPQRPVKKLSRNQKR